MTLKTFCFNLTAVENHKMLCASIQHYNTNFLHFSVFCDRDYVTNVELEIIMEVRCVKNLSSSCLHPATGEIVGGDHYSNLYSRNSYKFII